MNVDLSGTFPTLKMERFQIASQIFKRPRLCCSEDGEMELFQNAAIWLSCELLPRRSLCKQLNFGNGGKRLKNTFSERV